MIIITSTISVDPPPAPAAARFSVRSALVRQSVSQSSRAARMTELSPTKVRPPPSVLRPTDAVTRVATSDCNRFDWKFEV